MTLSIRTDRRLIRAGARSTRYLKIDYTAPRAEQREGRMPVNVAFVLDRSGSMAGENKFTLAREAVEQSLRMLRPEDRFALVVYDSQVDVISLSALATPRAIRHAMDALSGIGPRNSTDLCSGWMRGCEQVADFVSEERITRVLLLTDGLANQGITDRDTLARHASGLRERGVSTSTFGVGADFDERLLRDMAHEGGGNFYYLQDARQIPDLITSELGEALEVVIPRAVLELELPRGANAEVLNRFRSSRAAGDNMLRIELGDLTSAQQVEVLVLVNFARGEIGERVTVQARLDGASMPDTVGSADIDWTYASHEENDRQPRDREVDRSVADIYATRARADATEANRHGDFDAARRVIEATAQRIRQYAGDDPELNESLNRLLREMPQYDQAVMSPMSMKAAFYAAEVAYKGRAIDGKARKAPR
ncbi:MAG: VWA domain-containing protein [Gemmatimonadales bacterium]